jgi:hypothetical protein
MKLKALLDQIHEDYIQIYASKQNKIDILSDFKRKHATIGHIPLTKPLSLDISSHLVKEYCGKVMNMIDQFFYLVNLEIACMKVLNDQFDKIPETVRCPSLKQL